MTVYIVLKVLTEFTGLGDSDHTDVITSVVAVYASRAAIPKQYKGIRHPSEKKGDATYSVQYKIQPRKVIGATAATPADANENHCPDCGHLPDACICGLGQDHIC